MRVLDGQGEPVSGAQVEIRTRRHAFPFGSAVAAKELMAGGGDGDRYRAVVEQHFNRVVLENDLKWMPWEASRSGTNSTYRMAWTEAALAWRRRREITVRGHYVKHGV